MQRTSKLAILQEVNIMHKVRYRAMITEIFKQDTNQIIEICKEQKQILVQEEHVD